MNLKITPMSRPIYAGSGINEGFISLLLDHKRELVSGLSLAGLGLGFWTLFSYASLIGRPELFLNSISVGPSLFAWVATLVFFVFVFFTFVCANSLIFIYVVSLFNARFSLRVYVSQYILICVIAVFAVCMAVALVTDSAAIAIAGAFVFCFILLVMLSIFSRLGELLLANALRTKKPTLKFRTNKFVRTGKETKAYTKVKTIIGETLSSTFMLWVYAGSGIYLLVRLINFCVLLLCLINRRFPKIVRKSVYFLFLALIITFFSLLIFYPAYLFYKLANDSGGDEFRAFLVAVVAFQYGILPGVFYYRSKSRGWAKIRQVAIVILVSLFVVSAVAKGVYGKLLLHTALSMGVRTENAGVYLVSEKYPMGSMRYTSWYPEQVGRFTKVRGMVVYQFASIVYLCPPDFKDEKVEVWADRSGECLVGDKDSILVFADRPKVSQ
ncbi:hypothetical protein NA647_11705 [Pseudomonas stutzeri]|uniref:hypothetical protein n=1 Tax=Stutzerimonas stutzeri TaxID=316 RepID=UPI00210D2783|nr:hypothetical protein [Stutzerimonas stutzeri]MCQ4288097.1 hypothetical protein [Stutzerimonas stutzeri]